VGWELASFDQTVQPISDRGRRLPQSQYAANGKFPIVDQGEGLIGGWTSREDLLFTGALPVLVFGDHTRRVKHVAFPFVVGAQGVKLLNPGPAFDSRFLAYQLSFAKIEDRGYGRHFQLLRGIELVVPPLQEQRRIVEEIEKQFTRLDAAVSALKRVGANLYRYRASVLKAACEGELVPTEAQIAQRERRQYESGFELLSKILSSRKQALTLTGGSRYRDPEPALTDGLPDPSKGWAWASVEQLSTKVVDGVHKKPEYVESGIPFVTVRNLTAGPGIDFENLRHVREADHAEFIKRTNPEAGDILISKDGTLGVVRVVRTNRAFSIFVSVALIKPVDRSLTEFLSLALQSPVVQRQMVPKGSGLQHIHLEDLRKDCVPIPPLAEQNRIVAEVERRFSVVEELEKVVEVNLARAANLRQSILAHAFEGRLVPQDPNDEPASVLLERTRADRGAGAPIRARRRIGG
jgi:type I restriction enzyme S subunit